MVVKTKKFRSPSKPIEVVMQDGSIRLVTKLLTTPRGNDEQTNMKLGKSNKKSKEFLTVGLSLAPHKLSGYNVCAMASDGCIAGCLNFSGHAVVFPSIIMGRITKTRLFFQDRKAFMAKLEHELELWRRKAIAYRLRLAVRMNVFSDIKWEKLYPALFERFWDCQFYDYTKHPSRMLAWCAGELPPNYYLTFSRSEKNEKDCFRVLRAGGNITVVFENELPDNWYGHPVINGDEHDLRFQDERPLVVGLKAKGPRGKKDSSGFVVRMPLTVLNN